MKTKLLSLIISLFACSLLVAQEQPIQKVDVNGVYLIPDKMPEYPGGVPAMMKFLSSNVKYPVEAQKCYLRACYCSVCSYGRWNTKSGKGNKRC